MFGNNKNSESSAIKKLYVLHNSKTGAYHPPQCHLNLAEVYREMDAAVNPADGQKNFLSLYPEEYNMFEIGTYNLETGVITPHKEPKHVLNLIDVKRPVKRDQVDDELLAFVKQSFIDARQKSGPQVVQ